MWEQISKIPVPGDYQMAEVSPVVDGEENYKNILQVLTSALCSTSPVFLPHDLGTEN